MADYKFSPNERHAVFTVHGEICYVCHCLLNMKTMEVDHIIPESLLKVPYRLNEILQMYGLPSDFDLNTYANWLPAFRACNGKKRAEVFDPTPIIQILLRNAREKAVQAAAIAAKTVSDAAFYKALNLIERASKLGQLKEDFRTAMRPLVDFQTAVREPQLINESIHLTPTYKVHLRFEFVSPSDEILKTASKMAVSLNQDEHSVDIAIINLSYITDRTKAALEDVAGSGSYDLAAYFDYNFGDSLEAARKLSASVDVKICRVARVMIKQFHAIHASKASF